jgi:RHS repeat-associated protein
VVCRWLYNQGMSCMVKKVEVTGQRYESGIELYYYNARWYDASLGRFAQADTIIPPGVQGYDHYAYGNNSTADYLANAFAFSIFQPGSVPQSDIVTGWVNAFISAEGSRLR